MYKMDCFAYEKRDVKTQFGNETVELCTALQDEYVKCDSCPFYKNRTVEEVELIKYNGTPFIKEAIAKYAHNHNKITAEQKADSEFGDHMLKCRKCGNLLGVMSDGYVEIRHKNRVIAFDVSILKDGDIEIMCENKKCCTINSAKELTKM